MSQRSIPTFVILFLLFVSFNTAFAKDILINEIAWMGTTSSSNDEWIELYNISSKDISLENYLLIVNSKEIKLEGKIKTNDFFILERTDDTTLPKVEADLIYTGSMKNTGGKILLKDSQNNIIDEADFSNGWTYGDNETKQTMERIENDWQTSLNPNGSPKEINAINKKGKEDDLKANSSFEIKKESENFPFAEMISFSFVSAIALVFIKKQLKVIS